jgi:hypothetical protein
MKKKIDILYPKKSTHQHIAEENEVWYDYFDCDPILGCRCFDCMDSYDHEYNYMDDKAMIRKEKIDTILGLNDPPCFGDILPPELRQLK